MSATGRGAKRNASDYYPTPAWCTEAILRELVLGPCPFILEPCRGDGAIERVLNGVIPTFHFDWCEISDGVDFFESNFDFRYDFVITNPPFSLAQEFITKSLEHANCVVMLLRINFLGAKKRREWWRQHPPTAIYTLSERPSFTGNGTDATEYAWFVWDKTGRQKVGFYWI